METKEKEKKYAVAKLIHLDKNICTKGAIWFSSFTEAVEYVIANYNEVVKTQYGDVIIYKGIQAYGYVRDGKPYTYRGNEIQKEYDEKQTEFDAYIELNAAMLKIKLKADQVIAECKKKRPDHLRIHKIIKAEIGRILEYDVDRGITLMYEQEGAKKEI